MRQAGTLNSEKLAQTFVDHLLTLGINSHTEQDHDEWVIWVRNEDHLETAQAELENFRRSPEDSRYRGASAAAQAIREQEALRRQEARKNVVEMRGQWKSPTARGRTPIVFALIGICVLVGIFSEFKFHPKLVFHQPKLVFQNIDSADGEAKSDPFQAVKSGEVWRVVTPIFLHGDILHLAFNMYWLFFLGGQIENIRGGWRFAGLVLISAVVSNLGQVFLDSNSLFGGMSGVNYALFGFVWMRWRIEPQAGWLLSPFTVIILMVWFVACFTGVVGDHIANGAHAFGLLCGLVIGLLPQLLRR